MIQPLPDRIDVPRCDAHQKVRSVINIFASVAYYAAQGYGNPLEYSAKAAVTRQETGPSRSVRGPADVKRYEKTQFDIFGWRAGYRWAGRLCNALVVGGGRGPRAGGARRRGGFGRGW